MTRRRGGRFSGADPPLSHVQRKSPDSLQDQIAQVPFVVLIAQTGPPTLGVLVALKYL